MVFLSKGIRNDNIELDFRGNEASARMARTNRTSSLAGFNETGSTLIRKGKPYNHAFLAEQIISIFRIIANKTV